MKIYFPMPKSFNTEKNLVTNHVIVFAVKNINGGNKKNFPLVISPLFFLVYVYIYKLQIVSQCVKLNFDDDT